VLVTRPGNGLAGLTMASVTRVEQTQTATDPKAAMADAELVRYLDAHQQFPGTPALGPAPGFLRSATYEPAPSR
jgi:sigma-E factor negative regulatory protein RseA